jgi:SAM-dependent methyltransferase
MPEDPVEIAPGVEVPAYETGEAQDGREEARQFFARLPGSLNLNDARVLDVGCGTGDLCLEAARRGARRVLGVDIADARIRVAQVKLQGEPALPVQFRSYDGDLAAIEERFDVILTKNSFEHYGAAAGSPSAEGMVAAMRDLLVDGGQLAIGFGPLWHAPFGGHLDVRLPYAHLIFPEEVIFDEFRRVRPPGKTARTFEEGTGVNRMTLSRFRSIMDRSGLECLHVATNVSRNPAVRAMRHVARVPVLEKYCTQNVYGIWRKPAG